MGTESTVATPRMTEAHFKLLYEHSTVPSVIPFVQEVRRIQYQKHSFKVDASDWSILLK
jgi:hypothetical protein